jgi:hypothetical protein
MCALRGVLFMFRKTKSGSLARAAPLAAAGILGAGARRVAGASDVGLGFAVPPPHALAATPTATHGHTLTRA